MCLNVLDGLQGWTIHSDSGDHFAVEEDVAPGVESLVTTGASGRINHLACSFFGRSKTCNPFYGSNAI